jgi:hypothetical protein
MMALLDAKLANMPEWKAFRAIDRALLSASDADRGEGGAPVHRVRPRLNGHGQTPSYTALTDMALKERGKPIPTPLLMAFIGSRRMLDPDAERAKVTVTSTLSKSPLFKSVPWEGGRAWWYADRPTPKETAGG